MGPGQRGQCTYSSANGKLIVTARQDARQNGKVERSAKKREAKCKVIIRFNNCPLPLFDGAEGGGGSRETLQHGQTSPLNFMHGCRKAGMQRAYDCHTNVREAYYCIRKLRALPCNTGAARV